MRDFLRLRVNLTVEQFFKNVSADLSPAPCLYRRSLALSQGLIFELRTGVGRMQAAIARERLAGLPAQACSHLQTAASGSNQTY